MNFGTINDVLIDGITGFNVRTILIEPLESGEPNKVPFAHRPFDLLTIHIPYEQKTVRAAYENRIIPVPFESRVMSVPYEDRVTPVPGGF